MKNKEMNSRLTLTSEEILCALNGLSHWEEVEIRQYGGVHATSVLPINEKLRKALGNYDTSKRINSVIETKSINLNLYELAKINDALVEYYMAWKSVPKSTVLSICTKVYTVISKNYKYSTSEYCYPLDKAKRLL